MINKLILGTVQLGLDYGINNQSGKPSLNTSFEILNKAYENGIRILDTAEAYGNSQEVIGRFQKEHPLKRFNIITKLAANASIKKDEILNHILKNCQVLNTDTLYGYMFHDYKCFKKNINLFDEILVGKNKGIIDKVGISLYTNNEIEDIVSNFSEFDFIQIPFNLLDNQSKRRSLLEKARNRGIEVHIRSVFLQGLFFKDIKLLPEKLIPLRPYLKALEGIKQDQTIDTETLALQYVLQKEYIDYVLIGVDSSTQLSNNIKNCKKTVNIPHQMIDDINVIEEDLLNPSNWN